MSAAETGQATAKAIKDQARRLGLEWQLLPGAVITGVDVLLDGSDNTKVTAIPLQEMPVPGSRVMCLQLSDGTVYIIGNLGSMPTPGMMVARIRQTTTQGFTSGTNDFIDFDTADYDPWIGFDPNVPDRWSAPFRGIFLCNGRICWSANATSRRAAFINTNGTTSGTGTKGGQSLQTPATGTCQIQATGVAFLEVNEYVGLRGLQSSGTSPLNTDTTSDGGSHLEIIYLGQDLS